MPKGIKKTPKWEPIIEMEDGVYHGRFELFNKKGVKILSKRFNHGIIHGPCKQWDDNGKLIERCNYHDGKLHGKRVHYKREENMEVTETYCNGVLHGQRLIYIGGRLYIKMKYVRGFLHGELSCYGNTNEEYSVDFEYGVTNNDELVKHLKEFAPSIVITI
jgi:antitoxin component YwqK of YwqJK toxin-antitoxin module